jgi:CRISPR-associated endoribonuclease Cas6
MVMNTGAMETQLIDWSTTQVTPTRVKIDLVALEDAVVPLYNASGVVSMFHDMIESVRPRISFNLHETRKMKPWSFSPLKLDSYERIDDNPGFYRVKKRTRGCWFFKTLDVNVAQLLLESWHADHDPHLYKLPMKIDRVIATNHSYDQFPEEVSFVTMQFHSPSFFFRARKEGRKRVIERFDFTVENILKIQSWKLDKLGLVSKGVDVENIIPLLRIIRDDTTMKRMFITRNDGNGVVPFEGKQGFITFKINGTVEEREMIWEILRLSTFIGIGSKTGMGFGHCSIKSWK